MEFGMDVHMARIGTEPLLSGANVMSLQSPSTATVKLYGANIPPSLKVADIDLGPGIKVTKMVSATPTMATIEVAVEAKLPTGIRPISMLHSTADRAIAIYDQIGYVKVTPDANMGRLGGVTAAKQFAQFETVAYSNGADGKPMTADDIPLGAVPARWAMMT